VDDFVAVYQAKVGIARGQTRLQLRREEGNRFVVESWTQLTGVVGFFKRGEIYEYCDFDYVEGQILPRTFERSDDISGEDRNVRVAYDWSHGRATIAYQDSTSTVDIEPGVTNTLLMQVALMQSLTSGTRTPSFDVVGHKGRLRFDVSYEGDDRISIDGEQRALLRYSHSRVDSGIRTTFWAAPERAHLPLRARIEKNRKLKGQLELIDSSVAVALASD
jgi:hypothetical protein